MLEGVLLYMLEAVDVRSVCYSQGIPTEYGRHINDLLSI
jgi:hypothetical protein